MGGSKDNLIAKNNIKDIEKKLKITPLKSESIKEIIYELLTDKADPFGQNFIKPILPDEKLKLKVFIGNEGLIKETTLIPFKSKEWDIVLKTIQNDYREKLKTENYISIAKWLDLLEDQYKVSYLTFIPDDSIKIVSLPHATIFTEGFGCTNRDLATDCERAWTNLASSTLNIISNVLFMNGTSNVTTYYRDDDDTSTSNMYSQAEFRSYPTAYSEMGVIIRKDSSATMTMYEGRAINDTSDTMDIVLNNAGSRSVACSGVSVTLSNGETNKLQASGSTLTMFQAGVTKPTCTESTISSGTRGGFYNFQSTIDSSGTYDNFEVGDLAGTRRIWLLN